MKKVMIVDDYEDILNIISLVLKDDNIEVKCLTDTDPVFQELDTWKTDLLLLDVNLGSIDGRELCTQIKSHSSYKHIKVVLISAMSEDWKKIECKADAKIDKPFDIDELRQEIPLQLQLPNEKFCPKAS